MPSPQSARTSDTFGLYLLMLDVDRCNPSVKLFLGMKQQSRVTHQKNHRRASIAKFPGRPTISDMP